jgi:hypothetical protein
VKGTGLDPHNVIDRSAPPLSNAAQTCTSAALRSLNEALRLFHTAWRRLYNFLITQIFYQSIHTYSRWKHEIRPAKFRDDG